MKFVIANRPFKEELRLFGLSGVGDLVVKQQIVLAHSEDELFTITRNGFHYTVNLDYVYHFHDGCFISGRRLELLANKTLSKSGIVANLYRENNSWHWYCGFDSTAIKKELKKFLDHEIRNRQS